MRQFFTTMNRKKLKPFKTVALLAIILQFAFFNVQSSWAAEPVRLVINDGASNLQLKLKIERAVSTLLTDINSSFSDNLTIPLLPGSDLLSTDAARDLKQLWSNEQFRCRDEEVVEHLLTTRDGYQVRGIPLSVKHPDSSSLTYQEAVINFDKNGLIISFFYAISPELYGKNTKGALQDSRNEVTDIEERMMILNYVEHFRTAYNQKDIEFLRQVFSTNALIITGTVIKVSRSELNPNGVRIKYRKQNKEEYLSNLQRAFRANSYIKVTFDNVFITAHPTIQNIYGVTVHQKWNSSRYSDEGYVFMVWDFRNQDEPQIHVRTWQPEFLTHDQRIDSNDIFTLGDFDFIDR